VVIEGECDYNLKEVASEPYMVGRLDPGWQRCVLEHILDQPLSTSLNDPRYLYFETLERPTVNREYQTT